MANVGGYMSQRNESSERRTRKAKGAPTTLKDRRWARRSHGRQREDSRRREAGSDRGEEVAVGEGRGITTFRKHINLAQEGRRHHLQ